MLVTVEEEKTSQVFGGCAAAGPARAGARARQQQREMGKLSRLAK